MNDLLMVAFPSEQKAEESARNCSPCRLEYRIELQRRRGRGEKANGNIKLNQLARFELRSQALREHSGVRLLG